MPTPIVDTPEWRALEEHRSEIAERTLRDLFAEDPGRADRLCVEAGGLLLDYSKERVTAATMARLAALARAAGVEALRDEMLAGAPVNTTEHRAALHVALRAPRGVRMAVEGIDVMPAVHRVLDRMAAIAETVRAGAWTGASGRRVRNVVNVGIGGSDLGPRMACAALAPDCDPAVVVRFVSNVDGADLLAATRDLDLAETLFVVSSKTFTTIETMTNARTIRSRIVDALGTSALARHFVAVTADAGAAVAFGVDPAHVLETWDWVGGRFSLASAVGLPVMIAIGPERFAGMLAGMHEIDRHFATAPPEANLPLLLGLLGVWNLDFLGAQSVAVLPYDRSLALLPDFLQQLDMESSGKSVDRSGRPVRIPTGAVVWGRPGTDGQHAFFQLLHQGTRAVACEFVGVCRPRHDLREHHDVLFANLLAQTQALAFGRSAEEVASRLAAEGGDPALVPHRTFTGNRPSSVLLLDELTPRTLGALVATYEHKVATQGAVWDVNSFDQWGVELGKELAASLLPAIAGGDDAGLDGSTRRLLARYRERRLGDGSGATG